jgi:hypothetical protein
MPRAELTSTTFRSNHDTFTFRANERGGALKPPNTNAHTPSIPAPPIL